MANRDLERRIVRLETKRPEFRAPREDVMGRIKARRTVALCEAFAEFTPDKYERAALLNGTEVRQARKFLKGDNEAQQKADFDYLCEWLEENLGHPAERELPESVVAKVRGFELPDYSFLDEFRRKAEANKAKASEDTAKDRDTAPEGDDER